jgi:WD40 repeat protein
MTQRRYRSWLLLAGLFAALLAGVYYWWMPTYTSLDGHLDQVKSLAFFPEGHNLLVSSSLDGRIGLWELEPRTVSFVQLPEGIARCLSFSPDGKTLVMGIHEDILVKDTAVIESQKFKLIVWDWKTKKAVREIKDLDSAPTALIHSQFKPYLVNTSGSEINVWNADNWERVAKIDTNNLGGKVAGFVEKGTKLVVATPESGSIGVYDIGARKMETFQAVSERIVSLACREDEPNNVVVLTQDNLYRVDLAAKNAKRVVAGFEDGMKAQAICYSEKTNLYAVGVMELGEITFRRARVILFDGNTFAVTKRFTGIPSGVKTICVSSDGAVFACAGFSPTIRLLLP